MRVLDGLEVQSFIKQRQLRQVRNLRQEHGIVPRLQILMSEHASPVIDTYVRMKQRYADDIAIEVQMKRVQQADMAAAIDAANQDSAVQGVIVQLPLDDPSETGALCDRIAPDKDVDGLGHNAAYPSATAEAIDWLLAAYNVTLEGKAIAIVGHGKLVGGPLARLWKARGLQVSILDKTSDTIHDTLIKSEVIVTATGTPGAVKSVDVKPDAVVVDAGTASEKGVIVGDVEPALRERSDLTITPLRGGVGPLTYTVLFDHLIEACLRQAGKL